MSTDPSLSSDWFPEILALLWGPLLTGTVVSTFGGLSLLWVTESSALFMWRMERTTGLLLTTPERLTWSFLILPVLCLVNSGSPATCATVTKMNEHKRPRGLIAGNGNRNSQQVKVKRRNYSRFSEDFQGFFTSEEVFLQI